MFGTNKKNRVQFFFFNFEAGDGASNRLRLCITGYLNHGGIIIWSGKGGVFCVKTGGGVHCVHYIEHKDCTARFATGGI